MALEQAIKDALKSALPSSWTITEITGKMVEFGGPKDWKGIELMRSIGAKFDPSTLKWKVSERKLIPAFQSAIDDAKAKQDAKQAQYREERIYRYKGYCNESAIAGAMPVKSLAELKSLMEPTAYATFEAKIVAEVTSNKASKTASANASKNYDTRVPYLLYKAPSEGSTIKSGGKWWKVVSIGKSFKMDDDMADMISGFLGHEGEQVAYAYLKEITDPATISQAEIDKQATTDAWKAKQEADAKAKKEKDDLVKFVLDNGIPMPKGSDMPKGDTLWNDFTIYGGGTAMVKRDDVYYYIRNNGGDGDSWANNNVRTGGAGAIGVMCGTTPEAQKTLARYAKFCALFNSKVARLTA